MDRSITQVAKHLEDLGYAIVDGDEHWLHARHPHILSVSVRLLEEGYLITRWIRLTAEAQADRQSVLEAINGLNADALVARYYVDADGDLPQRRSSRVRSGRRPLESSWLSGTRTLMRFRTRASTDT
jgi:hypothetical protein